VRGRPLSISIALLLALVASGAGALEGRVLRVGTSGDYAPFSGASGEDPIVFEGFDVSVARAYAEERGLIPVFERFSWPQLLRDLEASRFDIAMSGVTITPERSAVGRFSVPVAETGAVVLARQPERFPDLAALNRPIIRIGVHAGGYLERVAGTRFRRATVVAIPDNAAVLEALLSADVHAVLTDTAEAGLWLEAGEGLKVLGPLTRDRKAYLVRADRPGLAADLDRWLLEREADGSLGALRRRYLGDNAGPAVAEPLAALLAAVDERLALMPIVGVAKRREGIPLVVERREVDVLAAAAEAVREAAAAAKTPPPPRALVLAAFRAQIEAAKQVQRAAIKDPRYERPEVVPGVDAVLRPALLRIGEKIARLIVALPRDLDRETLRAAARDQLRTPWLSEASRLAIADSIAKLSQAPRAQ
jgi:cyclohexadienyl dehydratase